MKPKIAITTESAADLSQDICKQYGIYVIPQSISIGEEEYKDGINLTANELFKKAELYNVQPKTAGISPFEYKEFFERLTSLGLNVIHIALSSKISSCFQNAKSASSDLENVYVIDSLNLSGGMGLLAIKGAMLRAEQKSAEEIVHSLEATRSKVHTSFILDDLEQMNKSGRCSALEKLSANLFGIHPSVDVIGGKLLPGKRFSGKIENARTKYIDDRLKDENAVSKSLCLLNYCELDKSEVDKLYAHLKETASFEKIVVNEAGCCISAHCGKGCVGIIFSEE